MKHFLKSAAILLSLTATVLFSSCATQTPETRISEYKHLYDKLPKEHQQLVSRGEIKKGMTKDAVYLAWGKPDKAVDLFKNNQKSTLWEYYTNTPHYTNDVYVTIGYGYGHYGHGCRYYRHPRYRGHAHYSGIGVGTSVDYTKELSASVTFQKERVTEWQVEQK